MLAMEALGLGKLPQPNLQQQKRTLPNAADHTVYQQSFTIFRKLYHDLKETMHLLHQANN
jgi:gluconokinase